jgi:hypothetical protein
VAFISITRRGASKGDAVERVAKRLDIPLERAMAIGDSVGDLAMLEAVGHPVVMGDADHELRGRFPSVGDAEDDGVLAALEWASER